MTLEITVYTTGPTCVQCTATKRALDKRGIKYIEAPLQDYPHVVAYAQEQGWTNAPVVMAHDITGTLTAAWSGFNLGAIKALVAMVKEGHVL